MDYDERCQLEQKLEIHADLDGCEGGDVLSALITPLHNSEYLQLDKEETEQFVGLIKKMVENMEQYYGREAVNGNDEDFRRMNEYYKEDGIPEIVVEGYTPPDPQQLEAEGKCIDHPHTTYSNKPLTTCETCWRIYFAKNPETAKA